MTRYRVGRDGSVLSAEAHRLQAAAIRRFRSSAAWQRAAARQLARAPQCAQCGHPGSRDNPLTADHVVPLSAGGSAVDPRNLATLCHRCNSRKGAA